jgi:uncharacterized protein (DUF433 family)
MPEAIQTEHPHIVRLAGVCGGEPVVDGLRVTVRHVATLHQRGETVHEIAGALGITEAQVVHALSYFFDHRDEILALIALEATAGKWQGELVRPPQGKYEQRERLS